MIWEGWKMRDGMAYQRKERHKVGQDKTRLVLLGLLVALYKANSMSEVTLQGGFRELKTIVRKQRGKYGLLLTSKLTNAELDQIRDAVNALPG